MSLSTKKRDPNRSTYHTALVPSRKNTALLSGKQINYSHTERPKEICQAFVPLLQAFCEELQLRLTKKHHRTSWHHSET